MCRRPTPRLRVGKRHARDDIFFAFHLAKQHLTAGARPHAATTRPPHSEALSQLWVNGEQHKTACAERTADVASVPMEPNVSLAQVRGRDESRTLPGRPACAGHRALSTQISLDDVSTSSPRRAPPSRRGGPDVPVVARARARVGLLANLSGGHVRRSVRGITGAITGRDDGNRDPITAVLETIVSFTGTGAR